MADNYVRIINTIKQQNDIDFGIIDSNDTIGGFYQVDTTEQRDAIPTVRRKEGMFCWVGGTTKKVFQLVDGITNDNWIEFKSGSSDSGGTTIDGYSHIWVGTEPPEDTSMIWLDTNEDGILNDESETDVQTVAKLLSRIGELENTVALLAKRVTYLEENGVVIPGGDTDKDNANAILLEDNTPILLEDGTPLLLETSSSSGGSSGGNDSEDESMAVSYNAITETLSLQSSSITVSDETLIINNNNISISNETLKS